MTPAYWRPLQNGAVGGVALADLAQQYGTPLYVYDAAVIHENLQAYQSHEKNPKIYYAVKANSNLAILKLAADCGAGFDIVSQGELMRVLQAGGEAEDVVFSGVAKTDEEIRYALEQGIGCFNVESEGELYRISMIAAAMKRKAPVSLRVNPNVNAQTHPYISTGMRDNKFGIALENAQTLYQTALKLPSISVIGIGCHIGSQILNLDPFLQAMQSLIALADNLQRDGIMLEYIDIGGGLGIAMQADDQAPAASELVAKLYEMLGERSYELHLQPGRSIVGNSGFLLSRCVGVKEQSGKRFVMLDAAMNDYIRPALYQAKPHFQNLSRHASGENSDIVGPVCETGDTFAKNIPLAAQPNDLIVMAGTGAYGMSMASQYNSRLRPAEVLIEKGAARLIRRRDSYIQLWENEML